MAIIKAFFRILIGVLFGIGAALALTPAFAAFTTEQETVTLYIVYSLILLCGVLCFFAPTIRRAFGRAFLVLGSSVFALPISAFLLSGRTASDAVRTAEEGSEGIAALGAGIAGVAFTGAATFIGVVIGAILLIIGLGHELIKGVPESALM
jgi:hypothetical protein